MRVANYVSGTALSVAVDTYVNVSAQSPNGSSTGYFYADSTCSGSSTVTATTVLLASGSSSSSQFYFKDPVASYWNLRAQSTGYNEGYSPLYFVASETPSQIQVQLGFEPSVGTSYHLVSGRCYEAEVRLASQQNYPANNANRSFSLQFSANSGAQAFASLDGCLNGGTANSTLSFSSTEAVKRFALKPGTSSGSLSLSSTGLTTVQVAYDISDGSLSSVRLEPFEELSSFTGPLFHPPVNAYGCFALKVQPRASNGAATNVAANTSATVSSSDYVFSFNDTCLNSSASLSVMLPSDYRQSVIFAKPATSGFLKGAAAVSGASGSSTTTELMRRPDSIEFSDLPIANAAQEPQLMQNYCQKITFRALWSGATATLPMEMRFKFIHSSGSSLYTNSSCLTSVANDIVTIASGQPSVGAVWVRSSGAVGDPVKIMPVVVGSSVQWGQLLMRVVAPPSFSIMHSPSGTMSSGQCVGLMPSVGSSLLGPVVAKLMIQSSTNLQGNGSGGYFYSDSSCTQAAGSNLQATMPAGTNSYLMPPMGYVKFATPLTTGTPMIQLQVDGFANAVLVVNGPSSCGSSNCIW